MKAKFISTKGEDLLAEIEVNGLILYVMDKFFGKSLEANSEVTIDIEDYYFEQISWEKLVKQNLDKRMELTHLENWTYFAYGKITSVDPMICNCGLIELEVSIESDNELYIGKYVGFKVNQLTAFEYEEYIETKLDIALNAYHNKNYNIALDLLTQLAHKDDNTAQLFLGRLFYYGRGTDQNYTLAAKWIEKSAISGNPTAQCFIGGLYKDGTGVTQSYSRARMWYQSASNLGSPRAKSSLAWIYFKGLGVLKNYRKALSLYQESSNEGDGYASTMLGYFYQQGLIVKQDLKKAVELYSIGVDSNNELAYYNLGLAYYKGYGVDIDKQKAIALIEKAADKGNVNAIHFMSLDEE